MLDAHAAKIKMYFVFLAIVVLSLLFIGGIFVEKNVSIDLASYTPRFISYVTYLKYKIRFAGGLKAHSIAQTLNVFGSDSSYQAPLEKAESIPVLVYHGILPEPDGSNINITVKTFEDQMFGLKKAGYQTVTIDQLYKFMRGDIRLPDKSFLLTFDDGRSDSVKYADPILDALGFKAVMFVISRYSIDESSNRYYLSKTDLKRMLNSGRWEVQSHTHDGHGNIQIDALGSKGHFFPNKMWLTSESRMETDLEYTNRVYGDLAMVKNKIEQEFNAPVIGFAVPFGDFGQYATNFSGAEHIFLQSMKNLYHLVFHQHLFGERFNSNYSTEETKDQDFYHIKRMDVSTDWNGDDIVYALQRIQSKLLPYEDTFETNKGWISSWGDIQIKPGGMTIKAESSQSGGAVILDGSRMWKNYGMTANVEVPKRNGVYVWFRFKDDFNNAACNFGNGFIHIEETVDGMEHVLKGYRSPDIRIPADDFEIGVRVKGRTAECLLNGIPVISTDFLNETLTEGGIGFKTWDTELGESVLMIKKISIEKI